MVWPFCPRCRSTLRVDGTGAVVCDVCGYETNLNDWDEADLPRITTYSTSHRPTPFWAKSPSEQEALRKQQRQDQEPQRATIDEPCMRCQHTPVGYYTVQLRSVDEGQTVFYECPKCQYTWSINN